MSILWLIKIIVVAFTVSTMVSMQEQRSFPIKLSGKKAVGLVVVEPASRVIYTK